MNIKIFVDTSGWMAAFNARDFLLKHEDKNYSFTDCTSFVVMEELKLTEALASDRHFKQAGFKPLLC
jgi:hypothetical protein